MIGLMRLERNSLEISFMASPARSRTPAFRSTKPTATAKALIVKAEDDFLASVMVSVSASLESMSEKEREQAVAAAEKAVAHLQ
jgi:hypothetical protein